MPPPVRPAPWTTTVLRHVGVVLDAAEERRGERGDEHGACERGADRRAEVGDRVLQTADLAALLVGHGRHGDAAELRCQGTDAEPGEQHRPRDDLGPAPASSAAMSTTSPANSARNPSRTTRRGEAFGNSLGNSHGGEQERDRQRQESYAGGDGGEAEGHRKEQRHGEEEPGLQEVLEEECRQPACAAFVFRSMAGSTSAPSPRSSRWFSHVRKSSNTTATGEDQPDHRRQTRAHSGASGLGCTKPHVPERRMPYTMSPRPEGRQAGARRGRDGRPPRAACRPSAA